MSERPHLLLITTDQLRRDSLGCYGGSVIETPNLDRLAATSTVYDNAWTASPWCLPSRSSIMTGCYPHTHRAYSNFRDCRLTPDRPNLYNTLGGLGYHVTHVGKCHYAPVPYGETKPDRTLPYSEFRDYYLSLGIDDLELQDDKQVSVWFRDDYAEELDQAGHLEAYRAKVWDKDAAKVFTFPAPTEWHPDAWVGRKAVERLSRADQDQPQFTWVSISGPHFPFDPPAEYLDRVDPNKIEEPVITGDLDDPARMHYWSRHGAPGRWIESGRNDRYDADYWRRLRTNYYANVALIDDVIGDLITAAEQRFGDDLVVIFTPDHGEMLGNHGIWGKGHCFYNDVLNVPFLVRRPGVAPGRSDDLVSLIDIFPTLVGLAGGDPGAVDGLSLAGEQRHQILLSEGEGFVTATDGRRKLARAEAHGRRFAEFFDLAEDPGELINRSGDPKHAAAERDLGAAIGAALLSAALP
ncbi:sulfatase-like hydrolase/transferase [Microlunatus parietis]|uniref:Arylsulfatase A-like enzyme n=1 Tax=Microlunatus parietis TaxID=682979 RepID=A0A7Y9IEV2_9ACTN|nr:sulfatase-like hydrolase/transferase [Microlunatus parietis]NYE75336.1 arylsulfatase A-like enzyme [Microlunatus parietis]